MTVQDFLDNATKRLRTAGIDSARLDSLILLEDCLQTDRSRLLAHTDQQLSESQISKLNNFVTQREQHIPLAYIRGKSAFFGREFIVNKHTLVPRPETEAIIEILAGIRFPEPPLIADVGTGTGCIGITAALELPGSQVHLYDIDKQALATARRNAKYYQVQGQYYIGDVLNPWMGDYTVVLANLPYVPLDYPVNQAAGFEPKIALFSGTDGLNHYRLMWQQIMARSIRPRHIIIESLPAQHYKLVSLAAAAGYSLVQTKGYVQHFALDGPVCATS